MIPEWHERFYLYRQSDVTGYSGTGIVAHGVRWEDGTCVVRWCVPDKPKSTVLYDSVLDVAAVHGHNGSTIVMWLDEHKSEAGNVSGESGAEASGDAHANVTGRAVAAITLS